jgi:predicted acetyltransferase
MLSQAGNEGMPFVEIVTDADNVASRRVIEANGGKLSAQFPKSADHAGAESLRYRISLGAVA